MTALPAYMTSARRWLLWRGVPRANSKVAKIPYYMDGTPRSGNLDSAADQAQLASYEQAVAVQKAKGDGWNLGFALGPDDNGGYWQGIDLDGLTAHPEWTALQLPGYVEFSPSFDGMHAIGYGRKFASLGSNGSGIEAYSFGRFFTVTGVPARHPSSVHAEDLAGYVEQALRTLHGSQMTASSAPVKPPKEASTGTILDLQDALRSVPADNREVWINVGQALKPLGEDGLKLWSAWSSTSDKFQGDEDLAKWHGFKGDHTDYRAVFALAARYGWKNPGHRLTPEEIFGGNAIAIESSSPWEIVSIKDVFTNPPSPPSFRIGFILPCGVLTLLGAHGGTGKSILALQAAICLAIGVPFLGLEVKRSRVLVYSAEDPASTIRHRVSRICHRMGVDPAFLEGRLEVIDATKEPCLYAEASSFLGRRAASTTSPYQRLQLWIERFRPEVLIIDNASDTFDANENERARVREFVRSLVRLGETERAAVLLLAHIDKQTAKGQSSGEGYSGSTAWHNSARSRLFLSVKDGGLLTLEHQKSNLGPRAAPIHLQWGEAGLLEHAAVMSRFDATALVLRMIGIRYDRGEYISTAANASNNAFKVLRSDPAYPPSLTRNELARIMAGAEGSGLLNRESFTTDHRNSRQRWKVAVGALNPTQVALTAPNETNAHGGALGSLG